MVEVSMLNMTIVGQGHNHGLYIHVKGAVGLTAKFAYQATQDRYIIGCSINLTTQAREPLNTVYSSMKGVLNMFIWYVAWENLMLVRIECTILPVRNLVHYKSTSTWHTKIITLVVLCSVLITTIVRVYVYCTHGTIAFTYFKKHSRVFPHKFLRNSQEQFCILHVLSERTLHLPILCLLPVYYN